MMTFYLLLMIFIIICVACLFPSGMSSVADGEDASSTLGEGKEDLFFTYFHNNHLKIFEKYYQSCSQSQNRW